MLVPLNYDNGYDLELQRLLGQKGLTMNVTCDGDPLSLAEPERGLAAVRVQKGPCSDTYKYQAANPMKER